jgi:hypothetical protein
MWSSAWHRSTQRSAKWRNVCARTASHRLSKRQTRERLSRRSQKRPPRRTKSEEEEDCLNLQHNDEFSFSIQVSRTLSEQEGVNQRHVGQQHGGHCITVQVKLIVIVVVVVVMADAACVARGCERDRTGHSGDGRGASTRARTSECVAGAAGVLFDSQCVHRHHGAALARWCCVGCAPWPHVDSKVSR